MKSVVPIPTNDRLTLPMRRVATALAGVVQPVDLFIRRKKGNVVRYMRHEAD
jgi:hypothetical protein